LKALSDSTARKVALILVGAVAVGLIVGVLVSAGNDDSSNRHVTVPELTIPGDSSSLPSRTRTEKNGSTGATGQSQTGGAQAPSSQPSSPSTGGGQGGGTQGGGTQGGGNQGGNQTPGQGTDQSGGAAVPP